MKIDKIISYILLAIIIIGIIGVFYIIINPTPSERFTEFYMLGTDGKAGNYPSNLTVGENGTLILGIVNHEGNSTNYDLVVNLNNNTLKNETFNLQNNETKNITFTFYPTQTGNGQKLEFLLYKLPNTQQPYRSLELLINVQ